MYLDYKFQDPKYVYKHDGVDMEKEYTAQELY